MNHVSASAIEMFLRCPQQWVFRYVEGIRQPPAVAMVQGTSLHRATEYNYAYKVDTAEDAALDEVLDVARDAFVSESESIEDWEDEEPGPALDTAVSLARVYHTELAPTVMPVEVEREFVLEDESWRWPCLGYEDVLTAESVIDIKTAAKKKSQSDLDTSLQAGIYLLERHLSEKPERFAWHVAVKTKTLTTQVLERSVVEPERVRLLVSRVQAGMQQVLDTGLAMPAQPGSWACSERLCGFWRLCEYGGRPDGD